MIPFAAPLERVRNQSQLDLSSLTTSAAAEVIGGYIINAAIRCMAPINSPFDSIFYLG